MSLSYHLVERKVPAGKDKGKMLWFGQIESNKCVDFEKVCEHVADRCTARVGDVSAVMRCLVKITQEALEDGHIVDLGKLGRLGLSAGSKGTETDEELTAHQMKKPRILFKPGKVLRRMLGEIGYIRVIKKKVEVFVDEQCDRDHG